MKIIFKIFLGLAVIVTALLSALIITALVFQNRVIPVFLKAVNSNISTPVEASGYRLSLVRRFPKASVELSDVVVLSSATFNRSQFEGCRRDTLFSAGSVSLQFRLTDLFNGIYNIESASVSDGNLSLLTDTLGGVNYSITSETSGNAGSVAINLDKVTLRNISAAYINKATKLNIKGVIENARLKSRIAGEELEFICNAGILINHFSLYGAGLNANAEITADLNLVRSGEKITFRKGSMKLESFTIGLSGFINSGKDIFLKITAKNIDLARAGKYLPETILSKYREYTPGGQLKAECILSGPLSRTQNLHTDIAFSVENGRLSYGKSAIGLKNLSLKGSFTNGKKNSPGTSRIEISRCAFDIGNASWVSAFSIVNFIKPYVKVDFSGNIIPDEILKFTEIPGIVSAGGYLKLKLKLEGSPEKKEKYSFHDLLKLNPSADIQLKSLSVTHRDDRYSFSDASGNIMSASGIWTEELAFLYKGQRIRLNGEITNMPAWLAGKPVIMKISGEIVAGNLNPDLFLSGNIKKNPNPSSAVRLPSGIEADIAFNFDTLDYRNFKADNITGRMKYRPGLIEFRSFSANTLGGNISGSFLTSGQKTGSPYLFQGNFNINRIDIKNCFTTFNNFGQDFIKAEHLSGTLSGSLKILAPLDSLFKIDAATMNAEGRYVIENGTLSNFEPVKALSKFIDISELENITFSKLENDLYIKNNYLAIPQMNISSSAADFTVSGKHSFDNSYDYHVKAYLSELLSKKLKKGKLTTEFGAVEDDGLGRTSVFLRITGRGEDVKVVYDLKAAGKKIKESLSNEKNNLKNILNEEYGWFKKDSAVKNQPEARPRFQIEWEETAGPEKAADTTVKQKENIMGKIFRKRKN